MSAAQHVGSSLLLRMARYRRLSLALVVALGLLAASGVIAPAMLQVTVRDALRQSLTADAAGYPYVLQASSNAAREQMAHVAELQPLADEPGSAVTSTAATPVTVRTVRAPLALGALQVGRYPRVAGEVTISERVATRLEVDLGDQITLRSGEAGSDARGGNHATVVGVTVDPAEADDLTVVALDPAMSGVRAGLWLSRVETSRIPALSPLMENRDDVTMRTVALRADEAAADVPGVITRLRFVSLALGLVALVLALVAGVALARPARRDVDALAAAGLAPNRAWALVRRLGVGALIAGELAAILTIYVLGSLLRRPLSGIIGQNWLHVVLPWPVIAAVLGATLLLPWLVRPAIVGLNRMSSRFEYLSPRTAAEPLRWSSMAFVVAVTLLVAGAVVVWRWPDGSMRQVLPLVAIAASVLAAPTLLVVLSRRWKWAGRRFLIGLAAPLVLVGAAVGGLTYGSAFYAATTTHEANVSDQDLVPGIPPGAYAMDRIAADRANRLVATYRQLGGGEATIYDRPDERSTNMRVTAPMTIACMERDGLASPFDVQPECLSLRTRSSVNVVVLGDAQNSVQADPGLVEAGKVGLVQFGGPQNTTALSHTVVDAVATPGLGGILPALVVDPDSALARQYRLTPSGQKLVVFWGFDEMSESAQARLRAEILRAAPTAEIADGTTRTAEDLRRAMARAVATVGALLGFLLLFVGSSLVLTGHQQTMRTLTDLAVPWRVRRGVAVVGATCLVVSGLLGCLLGRVTAEVVGTRSDATFGLSWLLPASTTMAAGLLAAAALLRLPRREGD